MLIASLLAPLPSALALTAALGLNVQSASLPDSLTVRIQLRISQVPGAVVGVAFRDLGASDTLYLGADETFHAASTMKVPVMIELYRRVDAGALKLDQGILLINRFGSIVDGSPYSLDAGDDSDSSMYRRLGQRVLVSNLIDRMITRSSNLATNALIELAGATNANATAHRLGARHTAVLRGVEDGKAFAAGLNNSTTARDLAVLLEAIERGTAATPASCTAMRNILLRQQFNDAIPAGLPPGTRVAHKTGSITGVLHDAAIVYADARAPYVLVVLTRGIPEQATARRLVADISRLVYQHVMSATVSSSR